MVPDAHKGKGLGNKFLNDLSRADVLLHIIDMTGSLDKSGKKVTAGQNDPFEDILFLEDEIDFWVNDILKREDWSKFQRAASRDKRELINDLHKRLSGLKIKKHHILTTLKETELDKKFLNQWNDDDILKFSKKVRRISKPMLIIANKIDKEIGINNLKTLEKNYEGSIIPCSALAEHFLRTYQEKEVINYIPGSSDFQILDKNQLNSKELEMLENIHKKILEPHSGTGVQKALDYAAFKLLDLICVYPVVDINKFTDNNENVLPDVFLVKKGTLLRDFVRKKIHSDLADHFIFGIDARTKKRLGENYELKHNDIIKIVTAK